MAQIGAYRYKPQEYGVESMNKAHDARKDQTIPTDF